MKKVLLVLAVASLGLVSCQKDEEVKPVELSERSNDTEEDTDDMVDEDEDGGDKGGKTGAWD